MLNTTNNNDVVTQETLNRNIPDKHKVGVTNKWSVPASSDPLKDIIDRNDINIFDHKPKSDTEPNKKGNSANYSV